MTVGQRFILRQFSIASLALGLVPAAQAQDPQTAQFTGRVTTGSGVPISGVEVAVLELQRIVTTDSGGRFAFMELPPGSYTVRCRRIGYLAEFLALSLSPAERKEVVIVLAAGTYRLPDIQVTAEQLKPVEYAYTHKYDDFFWRRLELTRFRGHLTLMGERSPDAETSKDLPT